MDLSDVMSDLISSLSTVKPFGWLVIVAAATLFIGWAFRWKPILLLTLSAAVYAIPFFVTGKYWELFA